MRFLLLTLATLLLTACQGDNVQPEDPNGPLLIKGTPVEDDENLFWPVVRIITGNSGCSATVIGKRVLVTAAHCARTGSTSRFKISYGPHKGEEFTAKITRSELYPNSDHDIALGYLNKEFPAIPASIDRTRLEVGDVITLAGYGCVRPGGGGGNDGVLRQGDSTVIGRNKWDTVTREPGGAALCYGDSGGPLFKDKKLSGINSKGNIKTTSYLARLDIEQTKEFFEEWSDKHDANICGFNEQAEICGGQTPPQPEILFLENSFYKVKVEIKDANPHQKEVVNNLFLMVLDFLQKSDPLTVTPPTVKLRLRK